MFHVLDAVMKSTTLRLTLIVLNDCFIMFAKLSSIAQLSSQKETDLPFPVFHRMPFRRISRCARTFIQIVESFALALY